MNADTTKQAVTFPNTPTFRRRGRLTAAAVAAVLGAAIAPVYAELNPGDIVIGTGNHGGERNNGAGGLFVVNPVTGARTALGSTNSGYGAAQPSSLAWDPVNNRIVLGTANMGFERNNGAGGLYAVDPNSGARTLLGTTNSGYGSAQPSTLAWDPVGSRIILGTANQGGERNNAAGGLYAVDPSSGARTLLGTTNSGYGSAQPSAVAWDPTGNRIILGTANQGGERNNAAGGLFAVDPSSGARTLLGTTNSGYGSAQPSSIAWDPTGSRFFVGTANQGGERSNGAGGLYSVDPATGARTLLGTTNSGYGAAQPSALAWDPFNNRLLLATANQGRERSNGAGGLYSVDPTTGARTLLGTTSSGYGAAQPTAILIIPDVLDFTGGNNLTVSDAATDATRVAGTPNFRAKDSSANLNVGDLIAAFATGDASARTGSGGANNQEGDFTLAAAFDLGTVTGDRTVRFRASDDLVLDAAIGDADGDRLDLELFANNAKQSSGLAGSTGLIDVNAAIDLNAGTFAGTGQAFDNTGGSITTTGAVGVTLTETATLGGAVTAATAAVTAPAVTHAAGSATTVGTYAATASTFDHAGGTTAATADVSVVATASATFSGGTVDAPTLALNAPAVAISGGTVTAPAITYAGVSTLAISGGTVDTGASDLTGVAAYQQAGGTYKTSSLDMTQPTGAFAFDDGEIEVTGGTLTPRASDLFVTSASAGQNPHLKLTNGAAAAVVDALNVGQNGNGRVSVLGGSQLSSKGALLQEASVTTVSGGSSWAVQERIEMAGSATLNVDDGASLTADSIKTRAGTTLSVAGGAVAVTSLDLSLGGAINVSGVGAELGVAQKIVASLTGTRITLAGGAIATPRTELSNGTGVAGYGVVFGATRGYDGSTLEATGGTLTLGDASSLSGFRTDGDVTVAADATLDVQAKGFATLGATTTLAGGTLTAANGVGLPFGGALVGTGVVNGKVSAGFASTIEATGDLSLGDAARVDGFFSDGSLYTNGAAVTLFDANQAVLGSLTQLGDGSATGSLIAANGLLVGDGKNLTGRGTVNGDVRNQGAVVGDGTPLAQRVVFAEGFTVSGKGTFANAAFLGTFAPGDSPAVSNGTNSLFGGNVEIEIGGLLPGSAATNHDQIRDSATMTVLSTATLRVLPWNNFVPAVGDTFTVLTWAAGLDGDFGSLYLDPFYAANGIGFTPVVNNRAGAGTLQLVAVSAVPEPGAFALLAIAGAGLLNRRRRA